MHAYAFMLYDPEEQLTRLANADVKVCTPCGISVISQ
jgi:hypothetical protein